MRRIGYGINSYHKNVHLNVDFAPFWIFALENLIEFICGYLIPPIPLPKIKIIREGEKTTVREYYGDLQQTFHVYVHAPIFKYCYSRMDSKFIELDYEMAKKAFYDKDKKFWDDEGRLVEEMRLEDKNEISG